MENVYLDKILIADRDFSTSQTLIPDLKQEGYEIRSVKTGSEALNVLKTFGPDLIILGDNLEDIDGLEVLRMIKQKSNTLVVFVSKKDNVIDKAIGLGIGADDYVSKPFNNQEILARIKAHLRRQNRYFEERFKVLRNGPLDIVPKKRSVSIYGKKVNLTPTEYEILLFLAENIGRVLTKKNIENTVWDDSEVITTTLLGNYIARIRKKLNCPGLIETKIGIGYRMPKINSEE